MRLSHLLLGVGLVLFVVGLWLNSVFFVVAGTILALMGIIRA